MIVIPASLQTDPKGTYRLYLILGNENVERITKYDPLEFDFAQIESFSENKRCIYLHVMYASPAEMAELVKCAENRTNPSSIITKLARRFAYKPEAGDGQPAKPIKPKTDG
jgi:hypothetical protein